MKRIIKYILFFSFTLVVANQIWFNLHFSRSITTIVKVAILLTIFELLLKPIIKILLLPLNILTLGLIRAFIDTFGLYLAVFLISDFSISAIHRYGLNFSGIIGFIITSFTISIIFHFFKSL